MSTRRRRRTLRAHWPAIVWLTAVWMMLWGELVWGNLVSGLLVAVAVTTAMPLPAIDFHGRLRPLGLAHLGARFVVDLVHASVQVSIEAFRFGRTPRGGVVGVRLRSSSDLYLTLVAELSSLVPGSLVIEANRLTGMLYLHVLNLEAYGGAQKVRDDVHALEDRVMRALASDEELSRAGIARSARAARSRATSSTLPPTLPPTGGAS